VAHYIQKRVKAISGLPPIPPAHLTRPVWGVDDSRLSIVDWPDNGNLT
jgi:hypothetical protein